MDEDRTGSEAPERTPYPFNSLRLSKSANRKSAPGDSSSSSSMRRRNTTSFGELSYFKSLEHDREQNFRTGHRFSFNLIDQKKLNELPVDLLFPIADRYFKKCFAKSI